MASNVKYGLSGEMRLIASARLSITDATTTAFDFGTPNDIKLALGSTFKHGDRLLVVITTDSDGTTDTITAVIQDADDNAGSFGTAATAITSGTLLMGAGDKAACFGVLVQDERPWIRVSVTESGATDTIACHCSVWAVGNL